MYCLGAAQGVCRNLIAGDTLLNGMGFNVPTMGTRLRLEIPQATPLKLDPYQMAPMPSLHNTLYTPTIMPATLNPKLESLSPKPRTLICESLGGLEGAHLTQEDAEQALLTSRAAAKVFGRSRFRI